MYTRSNREVNLFKTLFSASLLIGLIAFPMSWLIINHNNKEASIASQPVPVKELAVEAAKKVETTSVSNIEETIKPGEWVEAGFDTENIKENEMTVIPLPPEIEPLIITASRSGVDKAAAGTSANEQDIQAASESAAASKMEDSPQTQATMEAIDDFAWAKIENPMAAEEPAPVDHEMPMLAHLKEQTQMNEPDFPPSENNTIEERPSENQDVKTCEMKDWGVMFSCDLNWKVKDANRKDVQIILSRDPMITMAWKQYDQQIRFLGQLNQIFFEKSGRYEPGFSSEKVNFAGREAVLVKGYSKTKPDVQVRDYYYLHHDKLVGISFSLSPKERWEEGKLIIKGVKDSFSKLP